MAPLKIDYIEFTSPRLAETQGFLSRAFGWQFNDYGPEYQELRDAGVSGGIAAGDLAPPLVILKAGDLAEAEASIIAAGGTITRPAYAFPGGRRFHFREPGGTEMAVWSEV